MSRYHETFKRWQADPEAFWLEASRAVDWIIPPTKAFDAHAGVYGRWFPDATCNTCFNAVDRHVLAGRGKQAALLYDSPVTHSKACYTYQDLQNEVASLAALLQKMGVVKGDRVVIYMPMIPQTVFAMLACARIGAIHSVVFGGFAAKELAARLNDASPTLVMIASCGVEPGRIVSYKPLLDLAIEMSEHKPQACLVLQRSQACAKLAQGRDFDWRTELDVVKQAGLKAQCVPVQATDPLYILYTSGTTGTPKGVMRDHGGHMVALLWSMSHIYALNPGEVFWSASDVGWVVGHSYSVYAPLLYGATTVLYEGKPVGTPDPGAFWRVVSDYKIAVLFTAPTALRAIRKEDPEANLANNYDISSLRALFLAGERADPETVYWAQSHLNIPIIDHWWQTETGWAIVGNPLGLGALPIKAGSPTVPIPGFDLVNVDEGGRPLPAGKMGSLVIRLPLPPGALPTLWGQDQRMRESYLNDFPGFYKTADAGFLDEDGYVYIMGRTDDIINVAGHRLSTGGMEEVLASHPDVVECAVVGIKDSLKGEQPCGFAVLKSGVTRSPQHIEQELVTLVREKIGPVAAFKLAFVVQRLPKTRSGKILRATIKKIADQEPWTVPATIDDPMILDEIKHILRQRTL